MQEEQRPEKTAVAQPGTSAIVIANPTSGSYVTRAHEIEDTVPFLERHGWQAELKLTTIAGDARKIAQEAVQRKIDVVIVVGGDGTINEVIQELAGSNTALGLLPGGTVNVWAREAGIPMDTTAAREILVSGQTRAIDLGYIQTHAASTPDFPDASQARYFLLMVGIGLDGEVTHAVEKKPPKRLGVLGYLLIGTWLGVGYPGFRAKLQIDKRTTIRTSALQIIIGNTQLYGGAIKYTWQAKCDDGLLDICIVRKQNLFGRILVLLDFLLLRDQRRRWVRYEQGCEVRISTPRSIAIQLDGDPLTYTLPGEVSASCTIVPAALRVIVPQQLPPGLFSD
jgi:diacylglycerol kinase (ATP)